MTTDYLTSRAQRLVDGFEDGSAQLGGFSIRHGIAAVLYELVGQVVPEERAPHSVDPPESANTIAIYAMHAERTRLRGELVEIMDALTAPTLLDRALAGDYQSARKFLHEAGFTDQHGQLLPQFQPTSQED
jgi:hypothetical protein